ncbi:HAMP domain-containing sensor histidine kinase [Dactylosporangium sp. NPDC005572]|uniref:sensor histidine kinase n=1 Tax=Dactylosporangium sp. NPDC005572 TaxID=3156889 RepID=UPI0033A4F149
MTIRLRVTLFGLVVVSLVLGAFCTAVFLLLAAGASATQDTALAARAEAAVPGLSDISGLSGKPAPAALDLRTASDIVIAVYDSSGRPLYSTGHIDGSIPRVARSADRSTVAVAPGVPVRVAVRPVNGGYVAAMQTTQRVRDDRRGLFVLVCVYAVLAFLAAAGATWLVTGRALRPLRQLTTLVGEVGADPSRRLPPAPAGDEVGRLTTAFNAMMDRLQGSLAAQRRFVADASHELRTPLTTVRNNAGFLLRHPDAAEADRDAALRDIEGESARMSRLVEQLLTLARADAGQLPAMASVDLGALVDDVCRQARTLHPAREIHCALTPAPPVRGAADALAQLVWILVDNAVKYAPDGGNVWVTVTQRGPSTQLNVADDGPGIPPGAERHIFERFHRADESRSGAGAGLGLAIALSIVRAHDGTILAANNARGGASFVVDLPVAGLSSTS